MTKTKVSRHLVEIRCDYKASPEMHSGKTAYGQNVLQSNMTCKLTGLICDHAIVWRIGDTLRNKLFETKFGQCYTEPRLKSKTGKFFSWKPAPKSWGKGAAQEALLVMQPLWSKKRLVQQSKHRHLH